MGKVGTTSIARSLTKAIPQLGTVFAVHFIDDGTYRSRILQEKLVQQDRPIKIITLVREPIAKNISSFFQNYRQHTGKPFVEDRFSVPELTDLFLRANFHHNVLNWFDYQILNYLNIDVYQVPFPRHRGVARFQKDNFDLLILKSELNNRVKSRYLASFLNLDREFKITNYNIGSRKTYGRTYNSFKQFVKLPESYIDEMCGSRYFQHFYSPTEIARVRDRWIRR
nr:putative capsular polysaccharide synthesis family protein [Oxynema sp. CENA135]